MVTVLGGTVVARQLYWGNNILQCQSVSQSASSDGARRQCLLGKHRARPGLAGWLAESMIDLSESEVKSGAPLRLRVTTSLSSLLSQCLHSRMLVVQAAGRGSSSCRDWPVRTTYTSQWSLWVICCLQKYFRRAGNSCNNTTVISLLQAESSTELDTINPARSRAWYPASWPRYCVSLSQSQYNTSKVGTTLTSHISEIRSARLFVKRPSQPYLSCRPTSVLSNSVSNTIKWW